MATREQIVAEAREWIDTGWAHQGKIKGVGCDCAGLVIGVGLAAVVMTVDTSDHVAKAVEAYSVRPDPRLMLLALDHWMIRIRKDEAGAGDVIYRKYGEDPQHLGILTGPLRDPMSGVIHALLWPSRRVVEHRTDDEWHVNTLSAWRYPGLEA